MLNKNWLQKTCQRLSISGVLCERRFSRMIIFFLMSISLFVTGCGAIEPEKREYPLAIAWDYTDDTYTVWYGMANLSQVTEQSKEDESDPAGLKIQGTTLDALQEQYENSQSYYLDLGHVQVVVFSQNLLEQPEAYGQLVESMQENPVLGKNAYVFGTKDPEAVMALSGDMEGTLGEYLMGIYENHKPDTEDAADKTDKPDTEDAADRTDKSDTEDTPEQANKSRKEQKKQQVTLEDLYYDWNNEGKISDLPWLKVEEGQILLCEKSG